MNFLGLLKIVAFSLGMALLKLLDFFSHKHFEATVSIVCPIAAISSVTTGPYLDCSQMLRSAWGIALLKLPDLFIHRHAEATVSILFLIAAILFVITGPYLDCSKLLCSAWG